MLNFLGFLVDLQNFALQVPPEKIERLMDQIETCLLEPHTTPRAVAQIRGTITHMQPALQTAAPFLKNIDAWIWEHVPDATQQAAWDRHHELSFEAKQDLLFWLQNIQKMSRRFINIPTDEYRIWSDASDQLAGSHCINQKMSVELPHDLVHKSSFLRELWGVWVALVNRETYVTSRNVVMVNDNLGVICACSRNASKDREANKIIRNIFLWAHRHQVELWFQWRPRDHPDLKIADSLSRSHDRNAWQFNEELMEVIFPWLGLPNIEIDCFASFNNKLCPKYFSQFFDGGRCFGIDFFRQPEFILRRARLWANCPFDPKCCLQTVNRFASLNLRGYLLLPVWESQPFYRRAREEFPNSLRFSQHKKLFRPAWNQYSTFVRAPSWQIEIFFCNLERETLIRGRWHVNTRSLLDAKVTTRIAPCCNAHALTTIRILQHGFERLAHLRRLSRNFPVKSQLSKDLSKNYFAFIPSLPTAHHS